MKLNINDTMGMQGETKKGIILDWRFSNYLPQDLMVLVDKYTKDREMLNMTRVTEYIRFALMLPEK